MPHISMVLAEEILKLLENSGATQVEALAALQAANALIFVYLEDATRIGPATDGSSVSEAPP